MKIKNLLSTATAAATLSLASMAIAQPTQQTQQQPQQPQQPQSAQQMPAPQQPMATDVSSGEVDKFVSAYTDVQDINKDYRGRLQGVEDVEKANKLQMEAQEKMQGAIKDNGLSLSEYEDIANQVNENPELRAEVTQAIMQEMEQ